MTLEEPKCANCIYLRHINECARNAPNPRPKRVWNFPLIDSPIHSVCGEWMQNPDLMIEEASALEPKTIHKINTCFDDFRARKQRLFYQKIKKNS